MKIIGDFPRPTRVIEHCWIPLSDGTRLAARLWLPEDAEADPVPAIFEFIPYRKRDFYREHDESIHPYFAGHGYACVRVDIRGSGESEGVLRDEYLPQEQNDALEVLRWIAAQPWCIGKIGMMGISWGGFNSLQVAARRPPELKAIITVDSTDDRYADDVHYMGGCVLLDNFAWAAQMFVRNGRPPDPALVGERWRDMWLERLENTEPFILPWLTHQQRDGYWRHGSVCEDYHAIEAAVFAIGGWADGYSNSVPRLIAGLSAPRKGLIGPWPHDYPHRATPGPRIGFLQEALRWWDHWLKDIDTGVMQEPMYRVWMQESVPPRNFYDDRPGRWVAERSWPSAHVRVRHWALARGRLLDSGASDEALTLSSPQTTGLGYAKWCPDGSGPEMASDQREDDAKSLVFETEPLRERLEILGAPELTIDLASDRPDAMLAARLVEVAPDGAATLITYGLLNLTHREGHDRVTPLAPGARTRVTLRLNDIAHAFAPGNRIRLSLSTVYWPIVWTSPEHVTLTVFTEDATLTLPERPTQPADDRLPDLPPAEGPRGMAQIVYRPGGYDRRITREMARGETIARVEEDLGRFLILEADLLCDGVTEEVYRVSDADPLSARLEIASRHALSREGWSVRTETRSVVRSSRTHFIVDLDLDAYESDRRLFQRSWHFEIARHGA